MMVSFYDFLCVSHCWELVNLALPFTPDIVVFFFILISGRFHFFLPWTEVLWNEIIKTLNHWAEILY